MPVIPRFYFENVLDSAQTGLGDGSPRASGAVKKIDVDNNRFRLENIDIPREYGRPTYPYDADNLFNGCVLYFSETDSKYNIVEWENLDATSSWCIVDAETPPSSSDNATWRIYKINYEGNTRDYPCGRAADYDNSSYWKQYNPSSAVDIIVFLHNYINNTNFEYTFGTYLEWTLGQGWHFCDSTGVDMLGTYCMKHTGKTDGCLSQTLNEALSKDLKYRAWIKYKFINYPDMTQGLFRVRLVDDNDEPIDSDWVWYPDTTSYSTWEMSPQIAPDYDFNAGEVTLKFDAQPSKIYGAANSDATILFDGPYLGREIVTDRLKVLNHNWTAAVNDSNQVAVRGCFCDPARTHFNASVDSTNVLQTWRQRGTQSISKTFNDAIFPVYWIHFGSKSGLTYEASEIYLGSKLAFDYITPKKFDPYAEKVKVKKNVNLGGKTFKHVEYSKRAHKIEYWIIEGLVPTFKADLNRLKQHAYNDGKYFLYCWDEDNHPEDLWLATIEGKWAAPYEHFSDANLSVRKGTLRIEEVL